MLLIQLLVLVILLVSSAFFSSSETALFSLTTNQLEQLRRRDKSSYSKIMRLLNEPKRLIVTILLGNEFTNLLISSIMASLIIELFGGDKSYYNILICTPLLLLIGEITPKAIAIRNNQVFARFQAPLLHNFALLITPIRALVRSISDKLITLCVGAQRSQSSLISEDMLITLTREAVGEGVLEQLEAHYIKQIFKFGDATVDDAMVPRSNMLFVAHNAKPEEVTATIRQHKRDKLVIYKEKHDQVVGLLYARDLLMLELKRKRSDNWLTQLARKPMLVPETKSLLDLFHQMRAQKISVALVIDEYGGVTGQITLHDVLEFVFGEMPNEHKTTTRLLKKARLSGTMEVADFNRTYHTNLETEHGDTLNGLLIHQFGELPPPKVCIQISDVNFTVLKVANNRITQVMAESNSAVKHTPTKVKLPTTTKPTPPLTPTATKPQQKTLQPTQPKKHKAPKKTTAKRKTTTTRKATTPSKTTTTNRAVAKAKATTASKAKRAKAPRVTSRKSPA